VRTSIDGWRMDFIMKTGIILGGYDIKADNQADAQELLIAYQKHFAQELESIT